MFQRHAIKYQTEQSYFQQQQKITSKTKKKLYYSKSYIKSKFWFTELFLFNMHIPLSDPLHEMKNIYFIMLLTAINYNDVHVYCKTKVNDVDWKIELEI